MLNIFNLIFFFFLIRPFFKHFFSRQIAGGLRLESNRRCYARNTSFLSSLSLFWQAAVSFR